MLPLANSNATPREILERGGKVFATFDTQDSGNISYGVAMETQRYFVKTAGDPKNDQVTLSFVQRVELLHNAIRIASECRHPLLPALRGVGESSWGPMLFYDWADGELLGVPRERREDPSSAYQRFRSLPAQVIQDLLTALYGLHVDLERLGWVAGDFYDGCLIYDFSTGRLHLIDLDTYHQGSYRNTMGRMFGSSRFMAPEEFELGAQVDYRTTVFNLGRAADLFLGDGTLSRGAFRGADTFFDVARRACNPDPAARFATVAALYDAWVVPNG